MRSNIFAKTILFTCFPFKNKLKVNQVYMQTSSEKSEICHHFQCSVWP